MNDHPFKKGYDYTAYKDYALQGYTKAETARALGVSPQCVHHQAERYGITFKRKCKRGGNRITYQTEVLWSSPDVQKKWEKTVGRYTPKIRAKKTVRH